ncbi:MAG: ComF family protein [Gammaproteobacteria bacterium]|nr:ComF family protein [Gammaproteobacteria bacterium]
MIQGLKYRGELLWLRPLADQLADTVRARGARAPDCLLPVPQHWRRRCARGFNQALEIARLVGRKLGIPMNDVLLTRARLAQSQASLGAAERARNVRRAFRLATSCCPGLKAAIVDDVVTTGATVEELARMLKRAGAAEISVWALARAARP